MFDCSRMKTKNRKKGGGEDDFKVLLVVDVQNCFIQGGSLGTVNIDDLLKYINMVKSIEEQIKNGNYDLVVFSRDYHPENHASLYDETKAEYGVFTQHCRNTNNKCDKIYNTKNDLKNSKPITINELIDDLTKIKGFLTNNDYNALNDKCIDKLYNISDTTNLKKNIG